MAKIIAFDTSSDYCSVAVNVNGKIESISRLTPKTHTRLILPMIQEALDLSGLKLKQFDAVAYGCGPGSFTGLRIAAGVAQGLAFGAGLPVIKVSGLAALAMAAYLQYGTEDVLACIDARMNEIYWGLYRFGDNLQAQCDKEYVTQPENISLPADIENDTDQLSCVGSGCDFLTRFPECVSALITVIDGTMQPQAEMVARLAQTAWDEGNTVTPAEAAPTYLRDTVTWKKLPGR
jgi:tRNA threonylcarbamoyladenosine biosynthesis protein TsaB